MTSFDAETDFKRIIIIIIIIIIEPEGFSSYIASPETGQRRLSVRLSVRLTAKGS